jgi:predicted metalloprotease
VLRRGLIVPVLVTVAMLAAACGAPDPDVTATRSEEVVSINPSDDPDTPDNPMNDCDSFPPGEFPLDPEKPPQCYDQFLYRSLQDIQSYWATIYPQVYDGEPYPELEGGIYPAYPERTTTIPGCGEDTTSYEEIAGNAFYCGLGDFVAYDDAQLFPILDEKIGRAVLAVVLAHEWGHATQGRQDALGRQYPTYNTEQQADCFAGAWAAHIARGEAEGLSFTNQDVIAGLNGMILVADPVGSDEAEPGAHGSAFDRVRAFQDGYTNGALICRPYLDAPTESTLMPFLNDEDAMHNGNADPAELLALIQTSLDWFWGQLLTENGVDFTVPTIVTYPNAGPYPECEGMTDEDFPRNFFYCASTNEVMFDNGYATGLYDSIGDFSIGYLIGAAYADAVQSTLGSTFTGAQRALFNDCLTGVWTRALFPDSGQPDDIGAISPGDLDEAVRAALAVGDNDEDTDRNGTAFEKIEAYQAGVLSGLDECNATYGS